jgi:NADH:ubiquinone oxidoreductase subunit 6 (subunit J)
MPFIFIVPVWLLIVLVAAPLFFLRRLRFLGVHIVVASTLAILISFTLSISVLVAGSRLPTSRVNGVLIFGLFGLSLIGGGVLGLGLGIFLAHRINTRLAWWPVPDS